MKIVMNDLRKEIVKVLKADNSTEGLTLRELADKIGVEKINSGTTNPLVSADYIKVVGTKKVQKIVYVDVATYAIGNNIKELEKELNK